MLKFNNNNIFTGYLKQLLTSVNLPKYKIYTKQNEQENNKNIFETDSTEGLSQDAQLFTLNEPNKITFKKELNYIPYIKDDKVQYFVDGCWYKTDLSYFENAKKLNQTKQLIIQNNIYDTYTHEYLGNFLRYIRDYYNINLMSMYNCFSNNLCTNLKINITNETETKKIYFNSADTEYKIFKVPVKFFNEYTIALDSNLPIEICCGIAGEDELFTKLTLDTYSRINNCQFNHPIKYSNLLQNYLLQKFTKNELIKFAKHEQDLYLFIKIPANNTSSIVILEGDFTKFNNSYSYFNNTSSDTLSPLIVEQNKTITNFESTDFSNFIPISPLQLLSLNTGESYPFADRLIEYLSGNVITSEDQISDNIKRAQTVLIENGVKIPFFGLWSGAERPVIYEKLINLPQTKNNFDILGYVDKDAEKYYTSSNNSIANVDLYPNLYISSKN